MLWPTEFALSPLVMILYLTFITGVVLFSFVGTAKDDEEEVRAHRHAVFAVGRYLNWWFLGGLVGYLVVSRIMRYVVLPWFGITL